MVVACFQKTVESCKASCSLCSEPVHSTVSKAAYNQAGPDLGGRNTDFTYGWGTGRTVKSHCKWCRSREDRNWNIFAINQKTFDPKWDSLLMVETQKEKWGFSPIFYLRLKPALLAPGETFKISSIEVVMGAPNRSTCLQASLTIIYLVSSISPGPF